MDKNKTLPVIQSLQTGIGILELFLKEDRPLKFSEIQELSGITKSNLHKYLNTLTITGLLFRDKDQGTYHLGSKLIEFGNAAIGSVDLIHQATPYLKKISRELELTALLSVWTHDGPVIANIWNSQPGLNIGAQIGTRLPVLSSAGKAYLAFKEEVDIKEWKQQGFQYIQNATKQKLEEELPNIQKHYFSYAAEPLVRHVSSFSVPVLDYKNDMIGCITIVGFTQLIPSSHENDMSSFVINQAFELSECFGWQKEA